MSIRNYLEFPDFFQGGSIVSERDLPEKWRYLSRVIYKSDGARVPWNEKLFSAAVGRGKG